MSVNIIKKSIADGVNLTKIIDKKFKNNTIFVRFITKLNEDTVSANALVPNLLVTTNEDYPTRTQLTTKLSELYGSGLATINHKMSDNQVVGISANCICDDYALNGENVTSEVTDILLASIFRPIIENGGFEKMNFDLRKQELVDSIENEINNKRIYTVLLANRIIYKDEPSVLPSYGTKEGAEKLTSQIVYEAYRNLLKTAQIDIIYSGGQENIEAIEKITKAFASIRRQFVPNCFYTPSKIKETPVEDSITLDVNQCKMVMAFKTDLDDFYVNRFMTVMLGGTAFSKFFANVREKLSLCYYCAAGFVEGKNTMIVDSGVELDNIEKAKEEIQNQVKALADGDFTDEEMYNASLSIVGNFKSNYDSTNDLASWYFKQSIRGNNYSPEQATDIIKNITRGQIINAASHLKLDTVFAMKSQPKTGGAK